MFALFIICLIALFVAVGFTVACLVREEECKNTVYDKTSQQYIETVKKSKPWKKLVAIPLACVAVFLVLCVFTGFFTSVSTGHTGVVTTFGRVENYTLDSGVHVRLPWNKVIQMDNRVQKATINLPCFSSDIQEVSCVYTLNYQISKTNAQDIYKTVGSDYYDTVVTPSVAESVKTVMARYAKV